MLDDHLDSPDEPEDWVAALNGEDARENKTALLRSSLDAACFEYVHLVGLDNSAANLVEHGQHEESMEDECVHLDFLFVLWVCSYQVIVVAKHERSEKDKDN